MKHMKFVEAEPILGIQRIRNEVFIHTSKILYVLSDIHLEAIANFINDEVTALGYVGEEKVCLCCHNPTYNTLQLQGDYYFDYNIEEDEIILVKGYNHIEIVDALGNNISHDYNENTLCK